MTDDDYPALLQRAAEQDRRRRKQVDLQVEVINRLQAGATGEAVNLEIASELWEARARLERVADLVAAAPNRRSKLVRDLQVIVEND